MRRSFPTFGPPSAPKRLNLTVPFTRQPYAPPCPSTTFRFSLPQCGKAASPSHVRRLVSTGSSTCGSTVGSTREPGSCGHGLQLARQRYPSLACLGRHRIWMTTGRRRNTSASPWSAFRSIESGSERSTPRVYISNSWIRNAEGADRVITITFSGRDCRRCPSQEFCTRSTKRHLRRSINILPTQGIRGTACGAAARADERVRRLRRCRVAPGPLLPPAADALHRPGARPPRPRP